MSDEQSEAMTEEDAYSWADSHPHVRVIGADAAGDDDWRGMTGIISRSRGGDAFWFTRDDDPRGLCAWYPRSSLQELES